MNNVVDVDDLDNNCPFFNPIPTLSEHILGHARQSLSERGVCLELAFMLVAI